MKHKVSAGPIRFKSDGDTGEFQAVFSTFNVIDLDGDVTLPGAFEDGQKVRVAYWGHRWQDLPVGKGVIHADDEKAWIDGQFFLDTDVGRETYRTVKNLGDLQEYSYGYDIIEADIGKFEEQDVTFLKKLTVHEVSPVMLGAGIDTRTTDIKALKDVLAGDGKDEALQELHDMLISLGAKCAEREAEGEGDDAPPSGGEGHGKAGDGTPRTAKSSTLAARVAIELLESD